MHSWTLLVASLIMSGCIALLLTAVWLFNRRVPGLWAWALSFGCASLTALNYLYRPLMPAWAGQSSAALLTVATAALTLLGTLLYLGRPAGSLRLRVVCVVGLVVGVALLEILQVPRPQRFALFSMASGGLYIATAWLMWQSPRRQFPVRHLFAWLCGLHGLALLVRPWFFIARPLPDPTYQSMLSASHGLILEATVANLAVAFAVLMLVNEYLNAELRAMAQKDGLTDVFNRRTFLTLLDKAASLARRRQGILPLLVVDIDHFKSINDGHGHLYGDQALLHFVDVAHRTLRREDVMGRLGGEEFGVFLPNTSLADAHDVAERLRLAVAGTPLLKDGTPIALTVSIGVAHFGPDDELEAAIHRADQAMYLAKQSGRNRVVSSPDGPETPADQAAAVT